MCATSKEIQGRSKESDARKMPVLLIFSAPWFQYFLF